MIRSMPTTARPQQRYDHRLRNLVQRTGDVTVATDLGVPSPARRRVPGWARRRRSWSVWMVRTSRSRSSDRSLAAADRRLEQSVTPNESLRPGWLGGRRRMRKNTPYFEESQVRS
jgi:hypothetical protein